VRAASGWWLNGSVREVHAASGWWLNGRALCWRNGSTSCCLNGSVRLLKVRAKGGLLLVSKVRAATELNDGGSMEARVVGVVALMVPLMMA
jgi:hypothetical protein